MAQREQGWGRHVTHLLLDGDLGQVDLVSQMLVRHAVLAPIRASTVLDRLDQTTDIAVVGGLEADAHPPIEGGARAINLEVGETDLDNLRQPVARLLVVRHTDPRPMPLVDVRPDREGDGRSVRRRKVVESIELARMHVLQRDPWLFVRLSLPGPSVGRDHCLVQVLVESAMLRLSSCVARVSAIRTETETQ